MRYKNLIFDFDGVLADTNPIRINGFRPLFRTFPEDEVSALLAYAEVNGGLSRYAKIRYFFNQIRRETVSEEVVKAYAQEYSRIVKQAVIDAPAIAGSVAFLAGLDGGCSAFVISGSDQTELREVCHARGIARFFQEILGSPVSKEENLRGLIRDRKLERDVSVLIGDSINDLEAARAGGVAFIGRHSGMTDWKDYQGVTAFHTFGELPQYLQ